MPEQLCLICRAAAKDTGQEQLQKALQEQLQKAEVDRLQTERGVLAAKLGEAQQQLAEARKAIDQKEGHLQGLQVSSCPLVYSAKPAPLW